MSLQEPFRSRRRGSVLVLALVAVAAVTVLSLALLQMTATATTSQGQRLERSAAFYLAEAGLAEAYTGLAMGRTGQVGSDTNPAALGNGLFWVDAEDLGDGRLSLESTGMVGGSKAILSMVVEPGVESLASLGVFSVTPLIIPPGMLIDGYDSRLGTYEQQISLDPSGPQNGRLGTNDSAYVTGTSELPTLVLGDLIPGPMSGVTVGEDATVSGSTESAVAGVSLPTVVLPAIDQLEGIDHWGPGVVLLQPGQLGFEHIHVSAGAELVMQGPATIVVGALEVLEGSSLHFDTSGGKIELYVTYALTLASGSTVSTSGDDTDAIVVQVVGPVPAAQLHAAGRFYGMLYAPLASLSIGGDFELFGAVVANDLQLAPGSGLHFDLALGAQINEQDGLPELLSWRILELGVSDPGSSSRNPFKILGVDPTVLSKPADAHEDQWLALKYLDSGGLTQSYEGWESAFDWSDAQSVLALVRDGAVVAKGVDDGSGITPKAAGLLALLDQGLPAGQLMNALLAASPLADPVLTAVVNKQPLPEGDFLVVMVDNSPLAADVLQKVIDMNPPLEVGVLTAILAAQ